MPTTPLLAMDAARKPDRRTLVDEVVDSVQALCVSAGHNDGLLDAVYVIWKKAESGRGAQRVAQSLPIRAERVHFARRERLDAFAAIGFSDLYELGLLQRPGEIERHRSGFPGADLQVRLVDLLDTMIALRNLRDPIGSTLPLGIVLPSPTAITVVRVGFGGFPLGFAMVLLGCLIAARRAEK